MDVSVGSVLEIANRMLWVAFLLSMPVLGTALFVGVLVSLIQAVTSVQEMTLTFVPKLLGVMAVLALALPWMNRILMEFTRDLWLSMGGG